jgi:hypothetical protein
MCWCGGVHIKEARGRGMSAAAGASVSQSEMISRMSFVGLSHDAKRDFVDLYAWDEAHKERFQERLDKKILREARKFDWNESAQVTKVVSVAKRDHAVEKSKLQQYFAKNIPGIAAALKLTPVTESSDNILFIATKKRDHFFVYFGAMTETMVHIACWMVVPADALMSPEAAVAHKPRICFWMLNTFYAQQMTALENNGDQRDIDELDTVLNLKAGLEYPG